MDDVVKLPAAAPGEICMAGWMLLSHLKHSDSRHRRRCIRYASTTVGDLQKQSMRGEPARGLKLTPAIDPSNTTLCTVCARASLALPCDA